MGTVGYEGRSVNGEDVPLPGPESFGIVAVQNLYLECLRKGLSPHSDSARMDEESGVAALLHMHPIKLHNEVLVHALRAEHTGGNARRNDHSIPHKEGAGSTVHVH